MLSILYIYNVLWFEFAQISKTAEVIIILFY